MLIFNQEVFDDIVDTTSAWYTPSDYNEVLGRAEALLLLVYPTLVSGTSPTLTLSLDQSNDNQHWYQSASPLLNAVALVNNQMMQASVTILSSPLFAFSRLRFSLGGTTPQCQLKITAIGRSV